jgi:hypothetical protein
MKHLLNVTVKLLMIAALLSLTACGGGGGGGTPIQEQAVVDMSLTGGNDTIGSIYVELVLPEGFTLDTDSEGLPTDNALGTAIANSYIQANYMPEDATDLGQLNLALIGSNGFPAGVFSTLRHDLAAGEALPLETEFQVGTLTVTDLNGVELSGYDLEFTIQKQKVTP